nr:reverse transcriptase domain-containing protein [Tanacetum cinerariifolium]
MEKKDIANKREGLLRDVNVEENASQPPVIRTTNIGLSTCDGGSTYVLPPEERRKDVMESMCTTWKRILDENPSVASKVGSTYHVDKNSEPSHESPIVQYVDIITNSTSFAGVTGASAKEQQKINSNFCPFVADPVFNGVNISIPCKFVKKEQIGKTWAECDTRDQTRSSSKLSRDQTSNPTSSTNPTSKGRIRISSKQKVENSNFEEHLPPVATMADNRTMAEMLHAPTEGYAEAIVVPSILAEQFELKHSLINMMTSEQFFGLEKDNPHDHIRAAHQWLEKEPPRSITTWDDLVSKFISEFFPLSRTTNLRNEISNFHQKFDESFHEAWERYKDLLRACPHHGFTELHQLDTFYNALNPADQDSLNAAAGGNLLEKSPQDALTIIENKSKVHNS